MNEFPYQKNRSLVRNELLVHYFFKVQLQVKDMRHN